MKFPKVYEIATKSVVVIKGDKSVEDALKLMLKENHRSIVVAQKGIYKTLNVIDILSVKKKDHELHTQLSELSLNRLPTIHKEKNILHALEFLENKVETIGVLNDDNSLFGIITHTDIISNIDPETLMENYTLHDYLNNGKKIKSADETTQTAQLLDEMIQKNLDSIIIVSKRKAVGILTTKDVMRLIQNDDNLHKSVAHHMTAPIETLHEHVSIKTALDFINEKHYKRVVVVDDEGCFAGIITQKELISLTYSKWATLMKEHQNELYEINKILTQKYQESQLKASTDPLTGLYNRQKFTDLFHSYFLTMQQRNNSMTLIFVDIDHFKNVNDTYGHNVGDAVLRQVANTLLKTLRDVDIVARWGGEEFVILLPSTNLPNALHLAKKLKTNIQNREIDIVGHITASFGITLVKKEDTMQKAIERADRALYCAKKSGRNLVKTENECKNSL